MGLAHASVRFFSLRRCLGSRFDSVDGQGAAQGRPPTSPLKSHRGPAARIACIVITPLRAPGATQHVRRLRVSQPAAATREIPEIWRGQFLTHSWDCKPATRAKVPSFRQQGAGNQREVIGRWHGLGGSLLEQSPEARRRDDLVVVAGERRAVAACRGVWAPSRRSIPSRRREGGSGRLIAAVRVSQVVARAGS